MNSYRISGLPDSPSSDNDATSKKYVDTKTTDMATTAYVTGTSWTNNPTVADSGNADANYRLLYTAQTSGRATLYNESSLSYNPSNNTLTAGTFSGALSGNATTATSAGYCNGSSVTTLRVDGLRKVHVLANGHVGIGTDAPGFPLHVAGTAVNAAFPNATYYRTGGWNINGNFSTEYEITLKTENNIWIAGTYLWISSDQRIKKNIVNLNADKMMNILRNLRPISFNFIDHFKNGNKKKLGFIAQEINEILPEGITLNTDVIPNNMMKCEIDLTSKIEASFTLKPDDTDITLQYLLLTTESPLKFDTANPYSSTNVYKFKVYCGDKWAKEQDIYIRSEYNVIDDKYSYVIGMKKDVYDIMITEPTLFVYGQYVYDLHILDHDTIYTVATAALQEVDREQQADKARIAELEATVARQQSLINDILERLKKVGA
jgi:hypothetical protein